MKLIIFDIDGTILNTVKTDDACFKQTFLDLYQIDVTNVDWNDYTNVTDTGLTIEIFEKRFNRKPKRGEIEKIKSHFKNLLKDHTQHFTEIENSLSFIELASRQSNFEVAFATGGWKETAELKCNAAGLHLGNYIFKSSNDHYRRDKIIAFVIQEALKKKHGKQFDSITYFGDGQWDLKTAQILGIKFIGIDSNKNGVLKSIGVEKVIENFIETEKILNWIYEKGLPQ